MIGNNKTPDDWRDWLPEAQAVIASWEGATTGRMLSLKEATSLAEMIAQAMHRAYERARFS